MIAIVGFILFAIVAYRNRKNFFMSSLFAIYSISFASSVILSLYNYYYTNITSRSFFYLVLVLPVFFVCFRDISSSYFDKLDLRQIKSIAIVFLLFLIPAVFYYGYFAVKTFLTVDVGSSRIEGVNLIVVGPINTILSSVATFFYVPMLLFFIFVKENKYRTLGFFLLVSSLSFVFLTFCYSGRDGVVYWIMDFIVLWGVFRNNLSKDLKKLIKRIIVVFGSVIIVLFLIISFARFGDHEMGILWALTDYMGQQSYHFSAMFDIDYFRGYSSLFPGWKTLLGLRSNRMVVTELDYINMGLAGEKNVFGFFIKTLTMGYGKFWTVIIAIIFYSIVRFFVKRGERSKSITDFLIVFTLFQIPLQGVFYYRQGIGSGDVLYTIFIIMLMLIRRLRI